MRHRPLHHLKPGNAICYSGYREGQSPETQTYPSIDQIRQDLLILQRHWRYLRLYDCTPHAASVLQVIREDGLDFQVMLGAYLGPEVSNAGCPWGGTYGEQQLQQSVQRNDAEIKRLIDLARGHEDIVFSLAVGNESTVDWTDHLVPVDQMIHYVRRVRQSVSQPVTFCENYVPWQFKLRELVHELDFLSLHTYPVWEYKHIDEALHYTKDNVASVARLYPGKSIVVSEAGWTTHSNGRGIQAHNASQELQAIYCQQLMYWARESGLMVFVFEAFDEPWKGSPDPMEPEKHWGLYTVDRRPKRVVHTLFPDPVPKPA